MSILTSGRSHIGFRGPSSRYFFPPSSILRVLHGHMQARPRYFSGIISLNPRVQIPTQVVGEHESSLKQALSEFGVYLKPSSYGQDVKPLMKECCRSIFGNSAGLVDMMVQHFPSSKEGNASKVRLVFWLLEAEDI